ncbi:uncharacterized protein Gasu_30020 [Galdieria sulphuraria]|uniref:Uncharacterized protein n=1 Tax=Galdieria sulphuraria TaxID=130081 RepID=M2Y0V7_GALSU|nr:uncharacterized protein Gasu_30020 [Galdieria sulphuraria]EME29563.1 hypothetical protein Gasu_30020 [Galdieria sulphuraria]|eukprot:XP_005706083.1 hypothetical protein Gasu_30020 [Galdieria sulphuraria]
MRNWEAGVIALSIGVAASIALYLYYSRQLTIEKPVKSEEVPTKSQKKKKKRKQKNKHKVNHNEDEELDRIIAEINGSSTLPETDKLRANLTPESTSNEELQDKVNSRKSKTQANKFEEDLRAAVNVSLASVHDTGVANGPREERVLASLNQITDWHLLDAATRFLIAQWCHTVYCTLTTQSSVQEMSAEEVESFRTSLEKTYLQPAWDILNTKNNSLNAEDRTRFAALQLEISCRLHSPELMIQAYNAAIGAMSDSVSPQDRLVLYASAAIIGNPEEVKRVGKQLASKELEILHTASMRESSMIDYGALYHLSVRLAEVGKNLGFEIKYEWKAYKVTKAIYRLRKGAGVAPLRPGVGEEWNEQERNEDAQLIRTGAIVHYVNPGPVKIPITGFGGRHEMVLFGYVDVTDGTEQVRHTDFYTLKRSSKDSSLWVGKELVTMHALTGARAGSKVAEGILDVQLYMQPDPEASWKVL